MAKKSSVSKAVKQKVIKKKSTGDIKKAVARKPIAKKAVNKITIPVSLEQQLAQRNAELAIINSVQAALAAKLDMQAIYEVVGDKIQEIFDAQVVDICLYDPTDNLLHFPYTIERGVRFPDEPMQFIGYRKHVIETRQLLLINEDTVGAAAKYGNPVTIVGETPKSDLFVPLLVGNEAKGVISLQNLDRENAFSDSDVSLLTTLANAVSVALENARLFAETQRLLNITEIRAAELAIINSVQAALAAKLEMQAIYEAVGEKIQNIFDAQVVDIGLYNKTDNLLHFPYAIERGVRFPDEPIQVFGFRKHAIETGQYLLINNNMAEARVKYGQPTQIQGEAAKSCLFVPMIIGNETKGVTSLQNLDRENAFSESDVRLLETLSNAMSIALENASLFDETQRLLKITEDRAAELAIINSVQATLAAELNIQDLYDAVGDKIREIFNQADVGIRIYDLKSNLVHYPYIYENGERITVDSESLAEKGFAPHVLKNRELVIVNEKMEEIAAKYGAVLLPGTQMPKSQVFVPLVVGDQALGIVDLADMQREHAFNESDVRLLTTLSNSMSVALENARLFDETQRLFKAEQERVAELAIINRVQESLAAKLDMQGIYVAVGDKIRDIFNADTTFIAFHDVPNHKVVGVYYKDRQELDTAFNRPYGRGLFEVIVESGKPLLLHTEKEQEGIGAYNIPSPDSDKDLNESFLGVPLFSDGKVIGATSVQSYQQHAFDENDLRLLTTLTNSMSVALDNARLFKAEQERVAELQIINSIQQGLAAELDFQAIVDLVGDKLREVFNTKDFAIRWYDEKTNLVHYLYEFEKGKRLNVSPLPPTPGGTFDLFLKDRQPIIGNTLEIMARTGGISVPGTDISKSLVSVPIIASDHVIGSLQMENYERENAYGESELRLLTTIAASLGTALENARLFNETQRLFKAEQERVAELQIINSIQQGLAAELDFQAIVDLVGDKLREVFNTPDLAINWHDAKTNLIQPLYFYEHGTRHTIEPYTPSPGGIFETLVKTRQSLVWNTLKDYPQTQIVIPGTDLSKSLASVPIISSDRVIGSLQLENYERENAYGESELRLLTTIAASLGTALENARLFDETQRLLKITEDRASELSILNSVGEAMARTLDVRTVTRIVGNKVRDIFGAEVTEILLHDSAAGVIQVPYAFAKDYQEVEPFPIGEGLTSKVIQSGKPIVLGSIIEQAELGALAPTDKDKTESYMGVPIVAGEKMLGVVSVQSYQQNAYNESHVRLLQTLSSNMGVAIANARLFDETQRLLKITEDRAAELAIINSVQEGLASKLDMQSIYDLVGNKICEIFNLQTCFVMIYDKEKEIEYYPFIVEDGTRQIQEPIAHDENGFGPFVMRTRQPVMINEKMVERSAEVGSYIIGGGTNPRSAIYVPLLIGSEARGVISVQNTQKENAFTDSDLRLLTTLASSMSVALESARLFAETEQRAAELAIINSVQAELSANLEMQAMYQLVGEKLHEAFDAQVVTLVDYDPQNDRCYWRYAVEKGERLEIEPSAPVGFSKYVIENRQMILVNENLAERRRELGGSVAAGNPAKSYIGVPLLINNQVRGVISLQNVDHENAFTESDVRLLTTLANSMSVALENARLFEETERRASELATVNTVSSALATELDISALIYLVGEQTRTTFKADIAYVALLDEVGQKINFPYTYGEELTPLNYGEGITSKIIQTGKPALLNQDVDQQTLELGASVVGVVSQSYLGVPIFVSGRAVGVVSVQSTTQHGAFTENDERLLSTIAANVGNALHNARLYKEAQESRAAAEQANTAKSAFLANMSHELRTPLNAIIGFTRIVRRKAEGALPEKQTDNLDKVLTSAEHLLNLINTVLDIAKIEAGRMDVQASNFNISALADLCANTATPLLKPTVHLEKVVDESLTFVHSDQDKIKQIVLNLLSNAAKFTHAGKISLRLRRADTNLIVDVTDSGIGISAEALGRIFEEFQQADTSTTRQYGGTGLGLAISRNLARLLGGDLSATSDGLPGKGSTFTLTIPMQYGLKAASVSAEIESAQPASHVLKADSAKKLVLVIDDDPDAVYLLQENLGQNEFDVIGARSGIEGQQMARDMKPHAILLDIIMPDKDGWQVLHDLKADEITKNIPVILLTIVDKKALGFRLGASAYLLKPLNPAAVLEALKRVTGDRGHTRVLVVDDDPHVADMLQQLLPESDFSLESASDGVAGLEAIEAQRPDVVLLDIMMPRLDGFGVIEQLRANPVTQDLPIIVISAKELTDEESQKLRESVNFVMKKQGFDGEKLLQEINSVLEK